ncbi:MAG: hypothetical protein ACTSPX_05690 [Candidatus Thorarchaeota archaeon]
MLAKLSPHWINYHGLGLDSIRPYAADWVKVVDPDPNQCKRIKEELGAKIVARLSWLSSYNYGVAAKEVARQHARVMRDHPAWAYVDAWESLNEPGNLLSAATQEWLVEYWLEMMRLMEYGACALVWGNFSCGAPPGKDNEGPPNWEPYKAVLKRSADRHFLGLHEYWGALGVEDCQPWWTGRFDFLQDDARILITECGYNHAIGGFSRREAGFRDYMTEEDYIKDLAEYLRLIRSDPRIEAAFVFTHDYADAKWSSFDVASMAGKIGRLNATEVPSQPPEPPPQKLQPGEPDAADNLETTLQWLESALLDIAENTEHAIELVRQLKEQRR